jgi:hypothetical protein
VERRGRLRCADGVQRLHERALSLVPIVVDVHVEQLDILRAE